MEDIEKIVPHPRNPNTHPDYQIELLAKIIRANGWRNPIVVSNRSGFVIKGHARLEAARLAGFESVPVDYQDYANEAAEWQDMIADNRIAEMAETDVKEVKALLDSLVEAGEDVCLAGFTENDFEKINEINVSEGEILAREIEEEPEWTEKHDQAEKRVDAITKKLQQIKKQAPDALNKSRAIVVSSGTNQILIIDNDLEDVISELQRYVDAGEESPLSRLLDSVHKL